MTSGDRVIARDRVIGRLRAMVNLLRAMLREIFDESAYDRFLRRTNATRTRQSYGAFLREQETAAQKPRCC